VELLLLYLLLLLSGVLLWNIPVDNSIGTGEQDLILEAELLLLLYLLLLLSSVLLWNMSVDYSIGTWEHNLQWNSSSSISYSYSPVSSSGTR
jgi:hypothetical protein